MRLARTFAALAWFAAWLQAAAYLAPEGTDLHTLLLPRPLFTLLLLGPSLTIAVLGIHAVRRPALAATADDAWFLTAATGVAGGLAAVLAASASDAARLFLSASLYLTLGGLPFLLALLGPRLAAGRVRRGRALRGLPLAACAALSVLGFAGAFAVLAAYLSDPRF